VVQTFSAERPDHALRDGIRLWRVNGGSDGIDADASGSLAGVAPVDRIPIVQQMARFLTPGRCLDELTPASGGGRVGGHVDVHQLAPAVGDEDQHVQRLEHEGGDGEQVGGPRVVRVVGRKGAPGLAR
jgi:hypothetical protein